MYENSRNTILYGLITISLYICKHYFVNIIYMCNGHDLNTFSNINKFIPMYNNYVWLFLDAVLHSKNVNRLTTSETRIVDKSVDDYEEINKRSSPKPVSRTIMTPFASGLMIASVVIGCVVLLFIHLYLFVLPSGRCKKPDRSSVLF